MRIEKLHFKNINSLKGEHEVNFDESPLNSGGLFAIIGPTGSGKSTLLDAICLALYGRTPRISSVNKNKIEQDGSILTKYQKDAYAKVKFSCNTGSFISTWSISTNRNGNLREYDMDLRDSLTETSYSEKKTEVLAEIQRLIGLSYDQFVKSVLLSQGEFATLLQSNEKERSDLLEKITNTSIYRQIGQKVYEKHKSLEAKISDQKTLLKDLNEILLGEDKLLEMEKRKEELKVAESKQQQTLSQYEKDLDHLKSKEKLDEDLKTESKKLVEFRNAFDTFQNENAEKLDKHSKTLAFEEELINYNSTLEKKEIQKKKIESLVQEQSDIQNAVTSLKTEVETLLKTEVNKTEVESQLNAFLKTYQKLDNERQMKRNDYKSKVPVLNKELEVLGLEFNKQSIPEFKTKLQNQLKPSEQKIKSLQVEFNADETLEQTLKSQNLVLSQLKEAKHEEESIQNLKERIGELEIQLKQENKEVSTYPKLISAQDKKCKEAEKEVQHIETEKENQVLRLEVEELRKKLMKNEPCPVCGSEDHPYAEHAPHVDSELDKKLKTAKSVLQSTSNELARLKAENDSKSKRCEELKSEVNILKRSLQTKKEAFREDYKLVLSQLNGKSIENYETLTESHIQKLETFKALQAEIKALKASLSTLEELDDILKQGHELKAKLDKLYRGQDLDDYTSQLNSKWVRLNSNLTSNLERIKEEKKNYSLLEEQIKTLQDDLDPKIKASEFRSISEANASRMKSAEYQAKVKVQNELKEHIQIQKETIKGINKQLQNLKFEFFTDKNEAKSAINDLSKSLENTKNDHEEVKRQLKNNNDRLERFKTIKGRIEKEQKANKKWEILNTLIGDSTGSEFNKFAQDLSLQRLIHLGNKRLKHLNDRYDLDRYLANEDKNQLYVIDHHMGGMRRSVKTLSGGETFVMSLAMALGLSDLASKNVEINSLFIDEGFGTLDPETLDLTLDTLERLQAESNKTIGIISHVEALKERIQTQIVLERNAQGYSQLVING